MRFSPIFFKSTPLLLLLSACTSVPLASMVTLSKINFETTRLEDLRVAVELPEVIQPKARGVMLDVAIVSGEADEKLTFRLVPADAASEPKGQIAPSQPGRRVHAYKMSAKDVETLESTRQRLLEARQKGDKGSLGLGVAAREFCKTAPLPKAELQASTYIATTETGGYVPVLRNYDLRDDATVKASLDTLDDC